MSADDQSQAALAQPGALLLTSNHIYREGFDRAGGRGEVRPSGHRVYYGRDGRRVLCVDPGGQVLHECEWGPGPDGTTRLIRARVWLDWNAWVGIVPNGLINATTVDLSTRPGWQGLRSDDLRRLAAQAIGVPLSEVQFFYTDDDLRIDAHGRASIQHRKDAFYWLPSGGFDGARFMACMGAMHWANIDFLPVVELFQSLFPGTGSAVLELIRALYDDQHPTGDRPLRYRGIPTYPSEAAFGLFSGFFASRSPSGTSPFTLFMDPPRSHEVTWHPAAAPLRRVTDREARLCLTVQGHRVTKATVWDDRSGLSYTPKDRQGWAPNGRYLEVRPEGIHLVEGGSERVLPLNPAWGVAPDHPPAGNPPEAAVARSDWRGLFEGEPPSVDASEAFGAVLLYPEDEREIAPLASQPFVVDYLMDRAEQEPASAAVIAKARSILIDNLDAGIASLVPVDRRRTVRALYAHPAVAQRQIQRLWAQAARQRREACLEDVKASPLTGSPGGAAAYQRTYELIYHWLDEETWANREGWTAGLNRLHRALAPGGLLWSVGPASWRSLWQRPGLRLLEAVAVASLPTFRMHLTLLPKARVREGLTLFMVVNV